MESEAYRQHRTDASRLLGSAAYLLQRLSEDAGADSILRDMAGEWTAAYRRWQRDEPIALFEKTSR